MLSIPYTTSQELYSIRHSASNGSKINHAKEGWDKERVTDLLRCDNECVASYVHKCLLTLVEQHIVIHLKRLGWNDSNERIYIEGGLLLSITGIGSKLSWANPMTRAT